MLLLIRSFIFFLGCGHGGHLQHAISWFQDLGETECPTGCGEFCRSCRVAALSPKGTLYAIMHFAIFKIVFYVLSLS